jgi:uncharacterized protein YjiS (DUF1127 family)
MAYLSQFPKAESMLDAAPIAQRRQIAACGLSNIAQREDTREKMTMTAVGRHYATRQFAVAQSGAAGWLQAGIAPLLRMLDRQRQRRALLDLDDRQLRDIGRSREEAIEEGHKPFWM